MRERSIINPAPFLAALLLVALPALGRAQAQLEGMATSGGGPAAGGVPGTVMWGIIGEPMAAVASSGSGSLNTDDLYIGGASILFPTADLSGVEETREGDASGEGVTLQAAPQPAVDEVTLRLHLGSTAPVRLTVHDALGRVVATPVDGLREPGLYALRWRPDGIAAGRYIVRLMVDGVERATLPLQFIR